jgi:hypothetical protein
MIETFTLGISCFYLYRSEFGFEVKQCVITSSNTKNNNDDVSFIEACCSLTFDYLFQTRLADYSIQYLTKSQPFIYDFDVSLFA